MRGCLMGTLLIIAVAAGGLIALQRGYLPLGASERPAVEVSAAAADSAEAKLERMLREGVEVRLTEVELTSLFRYRREEWMIDALADPVVRLYGDTMSLAGLIITEHLPERAELAALGPFLPDTAHLEVAGHVTPTTDGEVALEVVSVELANLPIPRRLHPPILERIGRPDRPDLPPNAFPLPLPPGLRSARVEAGELILNP
jgi:hypothetical protein